MGSNPTATALTRAYGLAEKVHLPAAVGPGLISGLISSLKRPVDGGGAGRWAIIRGVFATAMTLLGIGATLEAIGLIVGVLGFRRTWQEFSHGDRLFERDIDRIKRAGRAAGQLVHRVLHRRQHVAPHSVRAEIPLFLSVSGRARWGYDALVSPVDDLEGFASEVERRINEVHEKTQGLGEQLADELDVLRSADEVLRKELQTQIEKVEALSRSIAIGGLREQVIGWSCIAFGFVLQVIAAFMLAAVS